VSVFYIKKFILKIWSKAQRETVKLLSVLPIGLYAVVGAYAFIVLFGHPERSVHK